MDLRGWFLVDVELREGCAISTLLFNVYMDGVAREVNGRVLLKVLELLLVNGGRFKINQLLYADDSGWHYAVYARFVDGVINL